jgi:hypothetical protein
MLGVPRRSYTERIGGHETWGNKKNRDIGYALAANSCERVSDVDTCTVAVPDAISAFAVPKPGVSSQDPSVFSGLAVERVAPPYESPSLLRVGNDFVANPFSHRRAPAYSILKTCQRLFLVQKARR